MLWDICIFFFFFNDTATTEIYTLSLHDALPISTYGEIAARLNEPGSARDVGVALARNPFAIVVPCHRVLAAGGKAGGFSAMGGLKTKLRLLMIERALPQGIFEAAR